MCFEVWDVDWVELGCDDGFSFWLDLGLGFLNDMDLFLCGVFFEFVFEGVLKLIMFGDW